jgi:hypothetical protein
MLTTHGMTGSKEYRAWAHMTDRCTKENRHDADRYVGRGIHVHPDWLGPGGFEEFISHIGPAPSVVHSIDRINNAGGYEPGNVRWATPTEQARNRRSNRLIVAFGRTQPLATWAEETGLSAATILARVTTLGWSAERAISTPVRKG